MAAPGFRCGFVSLLGRPNVGKSTLLNRLLGQKIAITSPKPQTTRNRIAGILNRPEAQFIFLDTPGLHLPQKELNRKMVAAAKKAALESDLAAMIIEAHRPWQDEDMITLELVESLTVPRILIINKLDLVPRERVLPLIDHANQLAVFAEIVPLSARTGDNVDRLPLALIPHLPEGPALFPEDMVSDQAERFLAAEIIREKIVLRTHKELPYATAVVIEEFEDQPGLLHLRGLILVERESQKPILIGKGGKMLKDVGSAARRELEACFEKKVFLELFVRVEEKWWDNPDRVREMGLKN